MGRNINPRVVTKIIILLPRKKIEYAKADAQRFYIFLKLGCIWKLKSLGYYLHYTLNYEYFLGSQRGHFSPEHHFRMKSTVHISQKWYYSWAKWVRCALSLSLYASGWIKWTCMQIARNVSTNSGVTSFLAKGKFAKVFTSLSVSWN